MSLAIVDHKERQEIAVRLVLSIISRGFTGAILSPA